MPVVAISAGLAVAGMFVFRAIFPLGDLEKATDAVGNYLQTVGGIYAVLLAFVVYVVWQQFNDARGFVAREATALIDLHRTASKLPVGSRLAIQQGLALYVDAVLAKEWPAMATGDLAVMEEVGELLEQVWFAVHDTAPTGECEVTVYGEVLSMFNDLTDVRTSRLTSARSRIPIAMKILLYFGAIITVGSMYLLVFNALWIQVFTTAALAGAVANILFLIRDLDDAFAGDWKVSPWPFERAKKAFARDLARHVEHGSMTALPAQ